MTAHRLLATWKTQLDPLHPALRICCWWQVALLLAGAVAMPLDHRLILGVNPWLKPLKFELSILVYTLTVGVLLRQLAGSYQAHGVDLLARRSAVAVAWVVGLTGIVEDSVIALQSLRGVRSHMNFTSPLNAMLFAMMGVFIAANTVALVVLLLLFLRKAGRFQWPAPVLTGVRLGLSVLVLGSLEGVLMVRNGQHTVGAPDSGSGVPLLNWSTAHGDLRIAHFFAVHALQVFPLAGLLFSRLPAPPAIQRSLVVVFAAAYTAGCGWVLHLAMQGRSPFS